METVPKPKSHAGPPLLLPALAYTLLFAAGVIAAELMRHGAVFVNPDAPAEAVREFFAGNPQAVRVGALFLFASSIPLGIYTATIVSRLHFLGVRAAGPYIALFGGFAASCALMVSALCSWVLSVPEASVSLTATKVLNFLSFLFGGVAFATGFGILVAGVAVTSYFYHLLPRWLVWFGLLIAVAGELSTFSLIASPMEFALPITRFGGILWLIAVGAVLPRTAGKQEVAH